jgi:exodeoxyribonuclease VII small subunit
MSKSSGTNANAIHEIPQDASYEDLVRHLEQSVSRLESGELSLEDAVVEYEFGMQIIERCNHLLDTAELRVTELSDRARESTPEPDNE